jgi:hypothetical protein
VVVTEWDEFRRMDLARLKREMAAPLLVDLRNIFSEEQLRRGGFKYFGIGNGGSSSNDGANQPVADGWSRRRQGVRREGSEEQIASTSIPTIAAAE